MVREEGGAAMGCRNGVQKWGAVGGNSYSFVFQASTGLKIRATDHNFLSNQQIDGASKCPSRN